MASRTRVVIDPAQVQAIEADPPTRKEIQRAGYGMAKMASVTMGAPRSTGRGANSIRGAVSAEDPNAADVAWGQRYFYMIFQEDGWSPREGGPRLPGKHFLRRAFEAYALY